MATDGTVTVLKPRLAVKAGEIVDASVMSRRALAGFIAEQIADAKARGVLFSLHLKATMMKVSDPIMFGVVVAEFYKAALEKHAATLAGIGFDINNGIGDLYEKIAKLPDATQAAIKADIDAVYADAPGAGDGELRQGHHQPARAQRRDRGRLDAGDDPRLGPHVERRRASCRTPRPSSPTAATPASTRW